MAEDQSREGGPAPGQPLGQSPRAQKHQRREGMPGTAGAPTPAQKSGTCEAPAGRNKVRSKARGASQGAETSVNRPRRAARIGVVVSDKMNKTCVVEVERRFRHPLYEKVMTRKKKYYVHDEGNEACVGNKVEIVSTRPFSKLKRWRLARIIGGGQGN